MAMLLESSGSLLSSVDALESVAAAASSTSSDWDSSVLTAHERLLKLCEEDAAAAAAEKVATATATTADALALPFGAAVHFAAVTPAFVEQAATARGGDTLAAALRLRVCESAAGWLEQTMRTSSLASTPPPLASLRARLLKRCTALLADPTLTAEEVHEQLAATLLLAPKPAAELASGFFDVRVAAAKRAAASE